MGHGSTCSFALFFSSSLFPSSGKKGKSSKHEDEEQNKEEEQQEQEELRRRETAWSALYHLIFPNGASDPASDRLTLAPTAKATLEKSNFSKRLYATTKLHSDGETPNNSSSTN